MVCVYAACMASVGTYSTVCMVYIVHSTMCEPVRQVCQTNAATPKLHNSEIVGESAG